MISTLGTPRVGGATATATWTAGPDPLSNGAGPGRWPVRWTSTRCPSRRKRLSASTTGPATAPPPSRPTTGCERCAPRKWCGEGISWSWSWWQKVSSEAWSAASRVRWLRWAEGGGGPNGWAKYYEREIGGWRQERLPRGGWHCGEGFS